MISLVFSDDKTPFFFETVKRFAAEIRDGEVVVTSAVSRALSETERLLPCRSLGVGSPVAGETVGRVIDAVRTPYFIVVEAGYNIHPISGGFRRFLQTAADAGGGMVYGDYQEARAGEKMYLRRLNDYQEGSFRDTFPFGPMTLFSVAAARRALDRYGSGGHISYGGWYDLRLKISMEHPLIHLREPLYMVEDPPEERSPFAYVNPADRAYQREMEYVATEHLKRLGAYLPPPATPLPADSVSYPVEASVVIPVRNRAGTIGDAIRSALSQRTDFPFNILVVDNHSTDGTTEIVRQLANRCPQVIPITPGERHLSIGGCWNEALYSPYCGRYVIQLDSDDLYQGQDTMQRMVDLLHEQRCAMAVGAYTLVDENTNVIPPGLVDHREWTDENGHNNVLRVEGFGAPRAFRTHVLRRTGFPDVGYGEDYAVGLWISRRYRVGRIFDSLYLCRRWAGNTDASPTPEEKSRRDAYKDMLRSLEILARRRMNEDGKSNGDAP